MPGPVPRPGIDRIKAHMLAAPKGPDSGQSILLHSNESAYGPSPLALEAAQDSLASIHRYFEAPDLLLAPAIAARFGVRPDWVVTGQGSDELLTRVMRAYIGPGEELIRSANGYLKVPNYAWASGADVVSVPDDDFVPSVDRMIAALTDRTRIVYLANPENPAGTYLVDAEVRRLHAALPDHVLLILDSAYEEYVDLPDNPPPHLLVEEADNVIMARTFSKLFGLAGARIGWLYAPPAIVDVVRKVGPTFPVTSTSAAAALAALKDVAHTESVRARTLAERTRMAGRLAELRIRTVPSQTNFILCHFPDPDRSAQAVEQALAAKGIVIRRLNSPAYGEYIRITLGLPHENEAVVTAIAEFLMP
jgi:histidinol-phosphate aminotransferase